MTPLATPLWMWLAFAALIVFFMALDLGVFNRKDHVVSAREALAWVTVWVVAALVFDLGVDHWLGREKALEFLTGFIIEKALSVDNLFVFVVIFSYFRVDKRYQHRVLAWGVLGALVLRGIFIFLGTALVAKFHWLLYVFGAFLLFTGAKILTVGDGDEVDPGKSLIVRGFRRLFPVAPAYVGSHFLTRHGGKLMATPLLVVLAMVEGTDVVFALDSIPAIFGVTTDPFIVYTSNIFAILGLRNLYFVLADFMDRFEYLKVGLGLVLAFVGVKMVGTDLFHVPIAASLAVIAALLLGSVVVSLWATRRRRGVVRSPAAEAEPLEPASVPTDRAAKRS